MCPYQPHHIIEQNRTQLYREILLLNKTKDKILGGMSEDCQAQVFVARV